MELYTRVSYELAGRLTKRYSTSFSLASRLYSRSIRQSIYAIYGMVRVADEIVDTYDGADRAELLDAFHTDVVTSVQRGYSANPIVQAFANAARTFGITPELIEPFFDSMRADLTERSFTRERYDTYVYGSAEVVGLMCLRVFCANDVDRYEQLVPGARALGAAYQKVNFLRDFAADHKERGRVYFPGVHYQSFSAAQKNDIIADIQRDFDHASPSVAQLPPGARRAVAASYRYYQALLTRLNAMTPREIKRERAHVPSGYKVWVFFLASIGLVR